ncbi:MAG: Ig domain-containing protein [Bacteroidales bacterium]|nr:Ig domain-containing protein [Bacteroidales bacterium]
MEVIPEIQTIPVESITVEPPVLTLIMTETESATLTATVLPEDATDPTVTWSSDNEEVATVDANGVVTAHKAGSAIITATAGEKTATCPVTVHNSISFRFYLTPVDAEINYGETVTYVAHLITTTNGEAVETDVTSEATWASSDKNVATIAAGTATAVGGGQTTISATFDPGGGALTTEVVLTVKDIVTYALKISPTTDDQPVVIIGKTQPFTLTLVTTTNDKAAESDITTSADWSISGDAAILTNNTATGVKEGKVTITGSFKPEGATEPLTASAELTVNKDPNHAGDQTPVEEEEEL